MGCVLDWLNYHETNLNLACLKADTFLRIRKHGSYDDIAPIPRVPKDRYLLPPLPMATACFDFPMATACFPQSDMNTNQPIGVAALRSWLLFFGGRNKQGFSITIDLIPRIAERWISTEMIYTPIPAGTNPTSLS
jgi:hypothetical protein